MQKPQNLEMMLSVDMKNAFLPQSLPAASLGHAFGGVPQLFHDPDFLGKGELSQRLAALAFLFEELLGECGHGWVRYFASNRLHASAK